MQSAASGLIEAFKAAFPGTGWDEIAYDMYLYGSGGIACWGTLCGIPNGCMALLNLIGLHGTHGNEILGHYSSTEWPTSQIPDLYNDPDYGPGGTKGLPWTWTPLPDNEVLAHTTSHSPLCHVSISKWCYEAGVHLGSTAPSGMVHKNDRCGKICADMSACMAELINHTALAEAVPDPWTRPPETQACIDCHWKSGNDPDIFPAQCGQMDCMECHMPNTYHTTGEFYIDDLWTEDGSGNLKTTFAPGDTIAYKARLAILGAGSFFVRTKPGVTGAIGYKDPTGTWKEGFSYSETCMSSVTTWQWTSTVPLNAITKGKFVLKLQVGDTPSGPLLTEKSRQVFFNVS